MNPDFIWAVFEEDISAQTREVYAQCEPEGFVHKPTKYIRADLVEPEITIIREVSEADKIAIREAALREAAALCDRYPYVEGVRTAIFELIGEKE